MRYPAILLIGTSADEDSAMQATIPENNTDFINDIIIVLQTAGFNIDQYDWAVGYMFKADVHHYD